MHQFHMLLSAALLLAANGNALPSPSPSPSAPAPAPAAKNSIVDLGYGKFEGVPSKSHGDVTRWLGLRYAEAPVGELRFANPKPLEAKKTKKKGGKGKCAPGGGKDEEVKVVKADKHAPFCLPVAPNPSSPPTGVSEDCLFADIYAPFTATASGKVKGKRQLLPVLVNIQGGGFSTNANPHLDGSPMAARGIVVVTFNYRVGPYGFLASKEIIKDKSADLNVGLLDQRELLKWVKKHIRQFGGDPNRVIISGASAGGASVLYHLTAYGGRDQERLFAGAIAQSPSFGPQFTPAETQYQYDSLLSRAKCKDLKCLRSLSSEELQSINSIEPYPSLNITRNPAFMYSPVIDGSLIPDYTYRVIAEKRFLKVPLMVGDTEDEGSMFVPRTTATEKDMREYLQANFPDFTDKMGDKMVQLYPKQREFPGAGKYWWTASQAYGETRYNCAALFTAQEWDAKNKKDDHTWLYRYNYTSPAARASGYGVLHTQDSTAVWGVCVGSACAPAPEITTAMRSYWESFVKTLNPNMKGSNVTKWEPSRDGKRRIVVQDTGPEMADVTKGLVERCKWWKSIGLELKQ